MGKMNVDVFRYLERKHFTVLRAIEKKQTQFKLVPITEIVVFSKMKISAVKKIALELCQNRLVVFESDLKYGGTYQLTNLGHDYLALKFFTDKNIICSFGNQIGTGKESCIFLVSCADSETR